MSRIRRALGRRISDWVWACPDDAEFVRRFAVANRRWRMPIVLDFDPDLRAFTVLDESGRVVVARRSRLEYYLSGVRRREEQLVREYLLARVPFAAGDRMIDVGANIGEVSRLLAHRHGVIPIAFEPEDREFRALEVNLRGTGGSAHKALLWSHETELSFHEANDTGDSSIFEPRNATSTQQRAATTLDAAIAQTAAAEGPIRLLKLEAEGAEPEILDGAARTLERVQFIAADVGPERGLERETTIFPVYERLRASGFRAVAVQTKRLVVLFENTRLSA